MKVSFLCQQNIKYLWRHQEFQGGRQKAAKHRGSVGASHPAAPGSILGSVLLT